MVSIVNTTLDFLKHEIPIELVSFNTNNLSIFCKLELKAVKYYNNINNNVVFATVMSQ